MVANTGLMQFALLIALLQVKHVICDGPLQTLAMVKAKSHYGRSLGLLHALIHATGSFVVLAGFGISVLLALKLAVLDGVLHYHVDYIKENLVKIMHWSVKEGPFWWALTTDQALHHLTYVVIALLALTP